MEGCIFCKIVKGEIPSNKIWEDKKHLAILSIYPNTPGFSVVLTKEHKPSYIFGNDDQTISDIALASKKVAKLLDAAFDDVGRTGIIFEGFGVDHLHSKLIPMHGTKSQEWKPVESGSNMKKFYENYPGYLSSHDSERADEKELSELAVKIRQTATKLKT